MLMYFFLHIVEVLNVLNLCGGHSYQCIHYFGCKKAVNSAIFHLCCTFIQGQLVKVGWFTFTNKIHIEMFNKFIIMITLQN